MTIRAALGASRLRLYRMAVAESLLLAVAAGAGGAALGAWLIAGARALIPASLAIGWALERRSRWRWGRRCWRAGCRRGGRRGWIRSRRCGRNEKGLKRYNGRVASDQETVESIDAIVERAVDVIGDRDEALRWLGTPVRALEYATPVSLLSTAEGQHLVLTALSKLSHGIV